MGVTIVSYGCYKLLLWVLQTFVMGVTNLCYGGNKPLLCGVTRVSYGCYKLFLWV
jgi:hypothetical protein